MKTSIYLLSAAALASGALWLQPADAQPVQLQPPGCTLNRKPVVQRKAQNNNPPTPVHIKAKSFSSY